MSKNIVIFKLGSTIPVRVLRREWGFQAQLDKVTCMSGQMETPGGAMLGLADELERLADDLKEAAAAREEMGELERLFG